MDEFALHKGHRYATVIMDAERTRVLWVGHGHRHVPFEDPVLQIEAAAGCWHPPRARRGSVAALSPA